MTVLYVEVPGDPAPKGSVSAFVVGHRAVVTHTVKSKNWEHTIRVALSGLPKLEGPVSLEAWFFLARPRSVTRPLPSVPPDLDKLLRAVMDGVASAYEDDSRVVDVVCLKRYATADFPPGLVLRLAECAPNLEQEHALLLSMRASWRVT